MNLISTLPPGEYIQRFLPGADTAAMVTALTIVYAFVAFTLTAHLKTRRGVRTAYTRKTFHFLTFTTASLIQIRWGVPGVMVFGMVMSGFVFYTVARGDGHPWFEALGRPTDAPHRAMFIIVPLITTAFGGLISNVLFSRFAYIGYLVCGWGDAVGEPVGTRWGKHTYRVPSLGGVKAVRSLEGSAAVFVVGAVAAVAGLIAGGVEPRAAMFVGVSCGLAGALVEAVSNHGLDNLTTQIAASFVAWWLL